MAEGNGMDAEKVERVARAICDSWGYNWDLEADDGNNGIVDAGRDGWDERPSRETFTEAAIAAIKAMTQGVSGS